MPRLSRQEKHFGTFSKNDKTQEAYIQWDGAKEGFVLRNRSTGKVLSLTAYPTVISMREAGVEFTLNGDREPIEKAEPSPAGVA